MENGPFGAGGHGKPLVRSRSECRGEEKKQGKNESQREGDEVREWVVAGQVGGVRGDKQVKLPELKIAIFSITWQPICPGEPGHIQQSLSALALSNLHSVLFSPPTASKYHYIYLGQGICVSQQPRARCVTFSVFERVCLCGRFLFSFPLIVASFHIMK